MDARRKLSIAVAAALAVAAGVAAWAAAAPIEPHLDIKVDRYLATEDEAHFAVTLTARGGETIDEVRMEPVSGPVHVVGGASMTGLKQGWVTRFRVLLDKPATSRGEVRVIQKGRIERSYVVGIESGR